MPDEDLKCLSNMCSNWNANLNETLTNFNIQKFNENAEDDARHNSRNVQIILIILIITKGSGEVPKAVVVTSILPLRKRDHISKIKALYMNC